MKTSSAILPRRRCHALLSIAGDATSASKSQQILKIGIAFAILIRAASIFDL
jgi:hypothetical protein